MLLVGTLKKEITVKVDSKGRMYLPPAIRRQLGKHPTLKKNLEGYLLTSIKKEDFLEESKLIASKPHCRTGKV